MGNVIIQAFLNYVSKHPDVIERLLELLIKDWIATLEQKHDTASA